MTSRQKPIAALLVLSLCLSIVCLPRFNRRDMGIGRLTSEGLSSIVVKADAAQYILLTEYYRGGQVEELIKPPFTYRPFVPALASLLPFEPMTAINMINLAAMECALLFLYALLGLAGLDIPLRLAGCVLFVFSFPTFYYGTIGYVDPVLVSFLMAGMFFIMSGSFAGLVTVLVVGAFVKETIILLLPVYAVQRYSIGTPIRRILLGGGVLFLVVALASIAARVTSPGHGSYLWTPSPAILLNNMRRPRSWVSFILTFGIPGCLSLTALAAMADGTFRRTTQFLAPFAAGIVMSLLLFAFSMVSAKADGRFVWVSYPFSIPMSMLMVRYWLKVRPSSA